MKLWNRKIIVAGWSLFFSLLVFGGCGRQPQKLSLADTAMGTVVQETLYVTDEKQGRTNAELFLAELEQLEKEHLSWRIEDSEVASINACAKEEKGMVLSPAMQADLALIWQVSEKSEGALDVTIGEVTRLWDLDAWAADASRITDFQEPETRKLQECLRNTGYEKVSLQEDKIYLPDGMCLDLGAVGKGIACDRLGDMLKECEEITGAVLSVGGSIVTYGSKPDGSSWNVAIMHPRKEGSYLGTLSLQGEWYVSTSGDYERYVEKDGVRYHHIMNPATGYPADSGVCSVTILSDSGLLSDALSTACFVLGVEEGMKLAQEFGAEGLFVTSDLDILMTEGMKQYFQESN